MTRLSLLLISTCFTLNAAALELAKYPQVFDAGQGISLILAPSSDGQQALLQVSGINHALDGVVLLAETKERGNDERDYRTRLDGRDYNLLLQRNAWGSPRYQLNLPGTDGFQLSFNETRTQAAKPAKLLALYQQQKKQGVQDKLARFDREQRVTDFTAQLQQIDQDASKACGTPLSTRVEWSALNDEQLMRLSVPSFCGEVVRQAANLCERGAPHQERVAGIQQVQCQFGERIQLREQNTTLTFTTHAEEPNQGDFINAFLRNR